MSVELVEDVLRLILESCSTSALVTLCQVSSTIRSLAIPHIMRKFSLNRSPRQVISFSNFVIDSTSNPGAHVFELELNEDFASIPYMRDGNGNFIKCDDRGYLIPTWGPLLTRALKLMPDLRSFTIMCRKHSIFDHSPSFVQTLLSLPHLKSFLISNIFRETASSLERAIGASKGTIIPQLQRLKVTKNDGHSDHLQPLTLNPNKGMGWLLSQSKNHLIELELSALDLRRFLNEGSGVTFSSITLLEIGYSNASVKDLAAAFPALRDLRLGCASFLSPLYPETTRNDISFPNLISIQGQYRDLYYFLKFNASRKSVRRMVIYDGWNWDDADGNAFPKIVPRLKRLELIREKFTPLSWWEGFAESLPELTYLDISIPCYSDEDQDLICNHIPTAMSSMLLGYLLLMISGDKTFSQSVPQLFANAIPTLKYIEVVHFCQEYMTTVIWERKTTLWEVSQGVKRHIGYIGSGTQ